MIRSQGGPIYYVQLLSVCERCESFFPSPVLQAWMTSPGQIILPLWFRRLVLRPTNLRMFRGYVTASDHAAPSCTGAAELRLLWAAQSSSETARASRLGCRRSSCLRSQFNVAWLHGCFAGPGQQAKLCPGWFAQSAGGSRGQLSRALTLEPLRPGLEAIDDRCLFIWGCWCSCQAKRTPKDQATRTLVAVESS